MKKLINSMKKESMKLILFVLLLLFSVTCNETNKQGNTETDKKDSTYLLIKENRTIEYPIQAKFLNDSEDSLYVTIDNYKLLITSDGKVYKSNDSLFFDIKNDDWIQELYFYQFENDLIAFYVFGDSDASGSYAKRINISENKIVWGTPIYGFNMAKPVIVENFAYLSTLGFVGKLNLKTGKYNWKFEDLYIEGKYNNFNKPEFFKNDIVLFVSNWPGSKQKDSILIDDKQAKILRID